MPSIPDENYRPNFLIPIERLKRPENFFLDACNFLREGILTSLDIHAKAIDSLSEENRLSNMVAGEKEEKFIPEVGRVFAKEITEDFSLIDIGLGNSLPTLTSSFLDSLVKANIIAEPVEYIAVDIDEKAAVDAATFIRQKHRIRSRAVVADYATLRGLKTHCTPLVVSWRSPLWLSPVSNGIQPDNVYASHLRKMGQLLGNEGLLFLTHRTLAGLEATSDVRLLNIHKEAALRVAKFIEENLQSQCIDPATGISAGSFSKLFQACVEINPEKESAGANLQALQDFEIRMGQYSVGIKEGDLLTTSRLALPSIRRFNRIAQISGAAIVNTLQDQDGGVVAQALQFPNLRR